MVRLQKLEKSEIKPLELKPGLGGGLHQVYEIKRISSSVWKEGCQLDNQNIDARVVCE